MNKYAVIFLLSTAMFAASCLDNKTPATKAKVSDSAKYDTSFVNDKNYLYKDLHNTNNIITVFKKMEAGGIDSNLYADSGYKKKYVQLTRRQRIDLVAPFILKTLKAQPDYARDLVRAYFIAKQNKIGDIQPIILHISGDDYMSLTMILLDKNDKYLCGYNISGGIMGGPTSIGDSLESYELKSYSKIGDDQITTYRLTETDHTDTTKKQITIDSNIFETRITPNGNFLTKQTLKSRYTKPSR